MVGDGVEADEDDEPERRPVQDPGLVGVPSRVLVLEGTAPVLDVDRVCVADRGDEERSRDPGGREDDGEVSSARASHRSEAASPTARPRRLLSRDAAEAPDREPRPDP